MEIQCVKGMNRLKVVSSGNISGFKAKLLIYNTLPYSALLVTSYSALHRKIVCALRARFCVSRKGGTGEAWGHPQGDIHMVAARFGCQSAMVGTGWANSCPGCMERLGKCYSHLVYRWLISGRKGCLGSERVYDN